MPAAVESDDIIIFFSKRNTSNVVDRENDKCDHGGNDGTCKSALELDTLVAHLYH